MDNLLALHGIGGAGLKATDKQALIQVINEAEGLSDKVKTDIVTMLGSPSTTADTYATIRSRIINDLVGVIGSPAVNTDTFAALIGRIQTVKTAMATNLTAKGQTATGTESLTTLKDMVYNIQLGKKFASGSLSGGAGAATVSGLAFKPTLVAIYTKNSSSSTSAYQQTFLIDWDRYPYYMYYSGWGKLAGLTTSGTNSQIYYADTSNRMTSDGFTFSKDNSTTVYWIAYE